MSADDVRQPQGGGGFRGFHTYADDTIRDAGDPHPGLDREPETWRRPADPAAEAYEPQAAWDRPEAPPARPPGRRASRTVMALALALAAAVAVAFAWGLGPARRGSDTERAAEDFASGRPQLKAELMAPPEAQAPLPARTAPASLLPTLPPSQALGPGASAYPGPPPVAAAAPLPSPVRPAEPPPPALRPAPADRLALLQPAPLGPLPQAAEPRARPAADCGYAGTPAQQLICGDPELATADRRMVQAYRAAVAAGAPERELSLEQQEWLSVRDDAARRSPRALADLYAARIDELRQWRAEAEGAPR